MSELTEAPAPPPFQYEAELQQWLAGNPDTLESGLWLVGYEFPLGENRVDLLGVDQSGRLVVIEVKRANATREAVGQVLDYVSALELMEPAEIAESINQADARPELAPVANFEREYKDRYGAGLANLKPVRALLASTSESAETERILEYLQGHNVDARSCLFTGYTEKSKRAYRRKRIVQPPDQAAEPTTRDEQDHRVGYEARLNEPCRAKYPRAGRKSRREIEEIHERSAGYPGVELFRSVHCTIIHALPEAKEIALPAQTTTTVSIRQQLPEAHEIAFPEHGKSRELTAAIAFDMAPTSKDERTTRPEYLRIRLHPESAPGEVLIVLFDRARWRAGDSLALLDALSDYRPYDGVNIKGEALDRVYTTADSWDIDRPILEQVLQAIHREWKVEWEEDRR